MRSFYHIWEGKDALSFHTVQSIVHEGKAAKKTTAQTFSKTEKQDLKDVRVSQIAWLSDDENLRNFLFQYVQTANVTSFGFDIMNQCDIQYTEYHASENGFYGWHLDHGTDLNNRVTHRKLSMTIQLSDSEDYEGGDFVFGGGVTTDRSKEAFRTKGTVLVFPSFIPHCITPVTKGVRQSLVAWFEGPRWR